ncbi:hypothetical protein HW571_27815 [Agrobacterium genomosp. 3]|jgi:hypothetical protein|uniref:DUF2933 domain-containing protein n=1 Tax=Agrobacterium tumefaciens TaxID=358 RepID=A0AAE6BV68_AGRTU|nr:MULTISPECIES: hypothetical protein [Agrobacterium tumefaciens complex]MCA1869426.1 hypothetical protein [Agrobacterium tomkonis]MCA2378815.1 hypothetical protein [Agrobacterium tomkonis RTP8]MCA1879807.1 hypothetical protein [Agrobacterium tumefaciens]MCA1895002.1 hypothetical protein [Agrobacterium tomkonis]MCA2371076.1 hypothetical protein [Agrobacterium tomkonis CIP 111-78]
MNTPNSVKSQPHAPSPSPADRLPAWLQGQRGLIVLGTLVLGIGIALSLGWLAAIGVAPLLLSVLPCFAMCALGLCMSRMTVSPDKVSPTISPGGESAATAVERRNPCCSSRQSTATTIDER